MNAVNMNEMRQNENIFLDPDRALMVVHQPTPHWGRKSPR
jgi:hypothetical protein